MDFNSTFKGNTFKLPVQTAHIIVKNNVWKDEIGACLNRNECVYWLVYICTFRLSKT